MKPQLILFLLLSCLGAAAQPEINSKKYPSLLWEISKPGRGQSSGLWIQPADDLIEVKQHRVGAGVGGVAVVVVADVG